MKKNFFLMSSNLLSKLLTNTVIFMFLARMLDTSEYGKLMYYYTISTLISIFIDYGFNLYTVKEMAKKIEAWEKIFNRSLEAKVTVTILVSLLTFTLIFFNILPNDSSFILFYLMGIVTSFINYYALPFRIFDQYKAETLFWIFSNILLFITVLVTVMVHPSIISVAIGFLFARLISFILLIIVTKLKLRIKTTLKYNFLKSFNLIKRNFTYGLHLIIGTMYFQLDTILLKHLTDYENVAYYQSAMRIVMAGLIFTEVISNILLPTLSQQNNTLKLVEIAKKGKRTLSILGLLITLILTIFSELIIKILFGEDYQASAPILCILASMLLFRYLSTIDGLLLTVLDKQTLRMILAIVSLILNCVFSIIFILNYGLIGAAFASLLTSFILMVLYKIIIMKNLNNREE